MTSLAALRLDLIPLSQEALAALIAVDRLSAEREIGAQLPPGELLPPEMADALDHFLGLVRSDPDNAIWSARAYVDRALGAVVGMGGFGGPPGAGNTVTLGYSIYPQWQRRGYATEAATALTDWALAQPGVHCVRATIVPGHIASEKVARAAGLQPTGRTEQDQEQGKVQVWERRRG